jgi:hypothetical protein
MGIFDFMSASGGGTGTAPIGDSETTGSRQDAGERLTRAEGGDHSGMNMAEAQAADPYGGTSWSGTQYMKPYTVMAADQTFDDRNYMYGRSPTGADDAANMGLGVGNMALGYGSLSAVQSKANADAANNRAIYMGDSGTTRAQNNVLGSSLGYGSSLANLEDTQGASGAQAQLNAGTNMAMAQQLALARSGRGFGGNAAAMGQAQGNMAGIAANQANQAASLRAQEDAAWRSRQAQNYGNAAQIAQAAGSQYGAQNQMGINAFYAGQGQNDAAAQGWNQQASDSYYKGIGASLAGQQQATAVRGMEMQGGEAVDDRALRAWAARNNYNIQQQQREDQQNAAMLQAGATTTAALIAAA